MWYFALFPGYSFIDISLLHSVLYNLVDTFNRHQRYSVSPLRNDRDMLLLKGLLRFFQQHGHTRFRDARYRQRNV